MTKEDRKKMRLVIDHLMEVGRYDRDDAISASSADDDGSFAIDMRRQSRAFFRAARWVRERLREEE